MSPDDLRYFRMRAREERERAFAGSDPAVRTVHLEMAECYERICQRFWMQGEVDASNKALRRSFDLSKKTSIYPARQ